MSRLSQKAKTGLLLLARQTVEQELFNKSDIKPDLSDPVLKENRGAFVTIHLHGSLKGCIGIIEPMSPLKDVIRDMAKSSAFRDPRFTPLTRDEYPHIDFEISVLTLPKKLDSPEDLQVARHGLIISSGTRRGLLLPQVAVDNAWDRETFLSQTCLKAGLPRDIWRSGALIEVFEAEVFSEKNLNKLTDSP